MLGLGFRLKVRVKGFKESSGSHSKPGFRLRNTLASFPPKAGTSSVCRVVVILILTLSYIKYGYITINIILIIIVGGGGSSSSSSSSTIINKLLNYCYYYTYSVYCCSKTDTS